MVYTRVPESQYQWRRFPRSGRPLAQAYSAFRTPRSALGRFVAQGVKAGGGLMSIVRTDTGTRSLRVRSRARVSAVSARAGAMVRVYSSRSARWLVAD